MKAGIRLEKLNQLVTDHYDHVWDCCCDHGLSGMLLLKRNVADLTHFVDIVKPITDKLESQLEQFFPAKNKQPHWQVHCTDAASIQLNSTQKHLVIIAGVGGDAVIKILTGILEGNKHSNIEFLLCPVHHNYKVRQAIIKSGLGLIDELLVKENNRFYELIFVSKSASQPVSEVGSRIWDFTSKDSCEYLDKTIMHFKRKQLNKNHDFSTILLAYQKLQHIREHTTN